MQPLLIALIVVAVAVAIYFVATKLPPTYLTSGSYTVSNGCLYGNSGISSVAFATATQPAQVFAPTLPRPAYTITIKKVLVAGTTANGFQGEVLQGQLSSGTGSSKLYLTWGSDGSATMLPSQSSLFSSAASQQVVFMKNDSTTVNPLYYVMPTTSYTAGATVPGMVATGGPPILYLANQALIALGTSADPSFCYNWNFAPVAAT